MLCQDEALLSDPLRWPDFFAGLCRGNALSCSSSPPCHFINPSSPTSDFIQKGFWSTAEGLGSQTSFCCAVQEEVVDSSKNPCCVIFRTVWGLWWRRRLALSCSPSESHLTPAGRGSSSRGKILVFFVPSKWHGRGKAWDLKSTRQQTRSCSPLEPGQEQGSSYSWCKEVKLFGSCICLAAGWKQD